MSVKSPSISQLEQIALRYKLDLDLEQLNTYKSLMENAIHSYQKVERMVTPTLPVNYARRPGYRPGVEENPYHAWYWKTSIKGEAAGLLYGKKIAIKDNVSVAGVPMVNGTSLLEGFVPDIDATIVTRILAEGGEIAGKAVCEYLCSSGASHTSDTGPVLNPHDPSRSTGGSSSGSAALLASGEVDMAIGGDQGGSIRVPSAWCGVFGLKPTYGLVPYTGIFSVDRTLDHAGPMARTTEDVALLLEAIAGEDGLDPRQNGVKQPVKYSQLLSDGINGLRIGIVQEGFGWVNHSEEDVDAIVAKAAFSLEKTGAKVEKVSIPMHRDSIDIWSVVSTEGPLSLMINGYSQGNNAKGFYHTKLMDVYANALKSRPNELSETVKFAILLGQYMQDAYHGRFYGIAQNLSRTLKAAYDEAFKTFDVLVMPTVPLKATKIPQNNAGITEIVERAYETVTNTAAFNLTGHPAMNVPCGASNGLPVGMMLIGQHGRDDILLRTAHAFETI